MQTKAIVTIPGNRFTGMKREIRKNKWMWIGGEWVMTNVCSMESSRPKDNGQMTRDKDKTIKKMSVMLSRWWYILYTTQRYSSLTLVWGERGVAVSACECERTRDVIILHRRGTCLYTCTTHNVSRLYSVTISSHQWLKLMLTHRSVIDASIPGRLYSWYIRNSDRAVYPRSWSNISRIYLIWYIDRFNSWIYQRYWDSRLRLYTTEAEIQDSSRAGLMEREIAFPEEVVVGLMTGGQQGV